MKPVSYIAKSYAPVIAAVLLSACASQPPKSLQTVSGWPEIEIGRDKKAVKDYFLLDSVNNGMNVDQETESSLVMSLIDTSGSVNAAFTQVMLGNAYSTPPKTEISFYFSQLPGRTKVTVNAAVSTQMPGGQINRVFLKDNNAVFNSWQGALGRAKAALEK